MTYILNAVNFAGRVLAVGECELGGEVELRAWHDGKAVKVLYLDPESGERGEIVLRNGPLDLDRGGSLVLTVWTRK